jgi:hypothetical protein
MVYGLLVGTEEDKKSLARQQSSTQERLLVNKQATRTNVSTQRLDVSIVFDLTVFVFFLTFTFTHVTLIYY